MSEHTTRQPPDRVIVQVQLGQVHQAPEVVVVEGADVVAREVQHPQTGHAPERVHPDLEDPRSDDVHLLQQPELLEDTGEGERVGVVVRGGDLEDLHARVHVGGRDRVGHASGEAGHLPLAALALPAGALGGAQGGGRTQPDEHQARGEQVPVQEHPGIKWRGVELRWCGERGGGWVKRRRSALVLLLLPHSFLHQFHFPSESTCKARS